MKVTIDTIAQYCGVSRATVSRVLASDEIVKEQTREKVLQAMRELGYKSEKLDYIEQTSSADRIVVIIMEDVRRKSNIEIARAAKEVLTQNGYTTIFTEYCEANERKAYLEMAARHGYGAIVIAGKGDLQEIRENQSKYSLLPITVVHWCSSWTQLDSVIEDTESAARLAFQTLIQLGHQRIVLVTGPIGYSGINEAVHGFKSEAASHNISVDDKYIMSSEMTQAGGMKIAEKIRKELPDISAAICMNYSMAEGIANSMEHAGVIIPDDFSIISFGVSDNNPSNGDNRKFSLVGAKYKEMGAVAAENVLEQIRRVQLREPERRVTKRILLQPIYFEGETTAKKKSL